jgi:leucyl-tRNA synthetase
MHMGHVRNYTVTTCSRISCAKDFNVLMPMGWDAFGPRRRRHENGVPPAQWTYDNIAYMKKRMQAPGMQPSTLGGRHLLAGECTTSGTSGCS